MKKILGLDLGAGSIGWAVVHEAETSAEHTGIDMVGTRAVPLTSDEKKDFESGNAITTNAGRRLKRGMRRNLQRFKLRRMALKNILNANGIINDDAVLSEEGNGNTFRTYRLRALAATEEVNLDDFARVLLMLNKKRGYKSNRKVKDDADGSSVDSIELAREMYDNHLTPAMVCLQLLADGKKKMPDFYRSDLQAEFDEIWKKQSEYYPQLLTSELKKSVTDKSAAQTYMILKKAFGIDNPPKRSTKTVSDKIAAFSCRSNATEKRIELDQLLYAFQDINAQISNASGLLGRISDRSKLLYINQQTIGQYLWSLISADSHASLKLRTFYRQDYMDEFDKIWETQSAFHKELTPELKYEIRNKIIFYQRPLKSQKQSIGICELEQRQILVEKDGTKKMKTVGNKVILASHPFYQEFRIWQTLNNVRVTSKDGAESQELTLEQKRILAEELSVKAKLTKQEVLKLLFPGQKSLDINYAEIMGNVTVNRIYQKFSSMIDGLGKFTEIDFKLPATDIKRYLNSAFSALGWDAAVLDAEVDIDTGIKEYEKKKFYGLWHLLYSFEGDNSQSGCDSLVEKLMLRYGFGADEAKMLANVSFESDYGSLCAKAIGKILPYMKEGNVYSDACMLAGYNHSRSSRTAEENASRSLERHIAPVALHSLRNPVVEKILNHMVNVVNMAVDAFGPFDEIRVELARELKKSQKERKQMADSIKTNDVLNQKIREILTKEFGIATPSRNDVMRYKLYCELEPNGFKTLYSGQYIPREKLFSKEIDIEHIIPQARLFDDSISNKTLEYRAINLEKGKSTAYDFVKQKYGEEGLARYEAACRQCFGSSSKTKLRKLLMTATDIPEGFVDRDLRNTQYISRKAISMLSEICRSVVPTTGSITDRLREDWQLVDVLKELNLCKYEQLGLVETYTDRDGRTIKRIKDWTKRNDHRHHAMDALTVAFTNRAFIQYFNYLNARWDENTSQHSSIKAIGKKYFDGTKALPPMPIVELRQEAKKHLENILVSIKPKNKVVTRSTNKVRTASGVKTKIENTPRGALSKDTFYAKRRRYVTAEEKVDGSFDAQKIATVRKKAYRLALEARLAEFGGDPKKAFTGKNAPAKNPIYLDAEHTRRLPEKVGTVSLKEVYVTKAKVAPDLKIESVVDEAARRVLAERLAEFGGDAKKAFVNLDENPVILHGHPLRIVTVFARLEKAFPLHVKKDHNGSTIIDEDGCPIPTDFVKNESNHHIAVFRRQKTDKKGMRLVDECGNPVWEWSEQLVSFIDAVERANANMPIVDKAWGRYEGWQFVFSMKKDEYFVFPDEGFNPTDIDLMDPCNAALISKHLFRVQKFTVHDYFFRHHLETTVNDSSKELHGITWKRIRTLEGLNGAVKVRIDHLGRIVAVGEY